MRPHDDMKTGRTLCVLTISHRVWCVELYCGRAKNADRSDGHSRIPEEPPGMIGVAWGDHRVGMQSTAKRRAAATASHEPGGCTSVEGREHGRSGHWRESRRQARRRGVSAARDGGAYAVGRLMRTRLGRCTERFCANSHDKALPPTPIIHAASSLGRVGHSPRKPLPSHTYNLHPHPRSVHYITHIAPEL